MAYRNYSTSVSHIVDATGQGDFTTIASALAAASTGETIFIRPGTYVENVTLKAGVNLSAFECDAYTPNVVIQGRCTVSFAGTCSISGIELKTNGDWALYSNSSSAGIINLFSCNINCADFGGIFFYSTASGAQLNIYESIGDVGVSGGILFSAGAAANVNIYQSIFTNSGSSIQQNTFSDNGGKLTILASTIKNPTIISASLSPGGGHLLNYTAFDCSAINRIPFSIQGATNASSSFSSFLGGTQSAIFIGATTTLNLTLSNVSSSNTNAITGVALGVLNVGVIVFTGTSSTVNAVLTTNHFANIL